jgi:enoyl-CoA hydratase/carnithine racemase
MATAVDKMLVTEVKGGIGTVFVNRPERANVLSSRMFKKFIETLDAWAVDEKVLVIVIRAAGDRVFIGGADTKEIVRDKRPETEEEKRQLITRDMAMATLMCNLTGRIMSCPQPVIAAINGGAFATGRMVAEACDIRIVADNVTWGVADLMTKGGGKRALGPNFMAAQRTINLVGLPRAMEIMLFAKPIDAKTGVDMGLFSMAVPLKDVTKTAYEVAEGLLARLTPTTLRTVKPIMQTVMNYQTPTTADKAKVTKMVTDGYGTDDFIEITKLWFKGQPPVKLDGKGPVRPVHFVDDQTQAAVDQALKTLGVS